MKKRRGGGGGNGDDEVRQGGVGCGRGSSFVGCEEQK